MDTKSDEVIFLGYSINSSDYKVYKTKTMMESMNVIINDTPEEKKEVEDEDDVSPQQKYVPTDVPPKESEIQSRSINSKKSTNQQGTINKNSERSPY